jgi:chromosome transmission fidelity protein 1
MVSYICIKCIIANHFKGIDLKDNVIIIDEAHNLLEAMAQMHNSELSYSQIVQGLLQVKCYKQRFNTRFSAPNLLSINQLIFVITKLQQLLGIIDSLERFHELKKNILDESSETNTNTFTVENFVLTAKIDNYNMFKLVRFCKDSRIAQKVCFHEVCIVGCSIFVSGPQLRA